MAANHEAVVLAFNDAINAGDLGALTALMTDDHRFIDPAGAIVEGRAACAEAWRGFFAAFPDYRNEFASMTSDDAGVVEVRGHSTCSVPELVGPARWSAVVRDGRLALWQVSDPGGS
jgi:ketosteroid isomerase-like protein